MLDEGGRAREGVIIRTVDCSGGLSMDTIQLTIILVTRANDLKSLCEKQGSVRTRMGRGYELAEGPCAE
jgi:hypothetical protein